MSIKRSHPDVALTPFERDIWRALQRLSLRKMPTGVFALISCFPGGMSTAMNPVAALESLAQKGYLNVDFYKYTPFVWSPDIVAEHDAQADGE